MIRSPAARSVSRVAIRSRVAPSSAFKALHLAGVAVRDAGAQGVLARAVVFQPALQRLPRAVRAAALLRHPPLEARAVRVGLPHGVAQAGHLPLQRPVLQLAPAQERRRRDHHRGQRLAQRAPRLSQDAQHHGLRHRRRGRRRRAVELALEAELRAALAEADHVAGAEDRLLDPAARDQRPRGRSAVHQHDLAVALEEDGVAGRGARDDDVGVVAGPDRRRQPRQRDRSRARHPARGTSRMAISGLRERRATAMAGTGRGACPGRCGRRCAAPRRSAR